jgi:hypothetical protein
MRLLLFAAVVTLLLSATQLALACADDPPTENPRAPPARLSPIVHEPLGFFVPLERYHDKQLGVTCWEAIHGSLACLPDSVMGRDGGPP